MLTIIVLVMKTSNTVRLVLAEMLVKESKKDVAFFSQRVKAEDSESNRQALADAEAMLKFYAQEVEIYS